MNAEVAHWDLRGRRAELGMSLLAWLAVVTTAIAVLVMWTLLSAPAEVASAVTQGVPELAGVLWSAVYDGIVVLLSWL